jgi:hypothetical protein
MGTEVKNTLFRFVTMRAPELLEKESIDKAFVQHPETVIDYSEGFEHTNVPRTSTKGKTQSLKYYESIFLSNIVQVSNDRKKEVLKSTALEFRFQSFKSREDVKSFVGNELFDFAVWLTSNRTRFTIEELSKRMSNMGYNNLYINPNIQLSYENAEAPDKGSILIEKKADITIWDNLFYQIITYKSGYVREALLSVLVAKFFLSHFYRNYSKIGSEEDLLINHYKKLAQARVLIPKLIFGKSEENNNIEEEGTKISASEKIVTPVNTKGLDKEMSVILENQKVDFLKTIVN